MAKINKKNILLEGLSGSIGNLVYRQMRDGSTRVSQKPDCSERVWSKAQTEHRGRMKLASAYAKEAKNWAFYIERVDPTKDSQSAYNLAVADWFHPPVIQGIERIDGRVRVEASDNMQVTVVEVRILDEEGKVLEQGQAAQVDPLSWEYTPVVEGAVEASAWDFAGNVTTRVLQHGQSPQ